MKEIKNIKRVLFMLLGFISLAIGIAGTVLPILPGGPFYLFALFCFTKSSKSVENWFKSTSIYEKYVLAFLQKKGMTRKEKIRINIIADFFILISVIYIDILILKITLIVLALYKHYYFIYKIKTISTADTKQDKARTL
ncbi:YbaN family protein [Metabacillus halosaccharovorans]|uniref:YbaN family protein n=1 Tax=Metabacillus halosaccharovorans TaxID=930124 RepID=A0ABT3DMF0_9BACI|nr:YbaN family protein [Metabacillus halosaccharovorans]MCM3443428.1 YbaN family protein [Metabacillus halosaccharovorans]MCV9888053.1 YbaN family protein [Metabacillus halosaccharovorans]